MILVTGATGLVGGHLLWHLMRDNEKVVAIKRTSSRLEPLRTIFSFYTNEPDVFLRKIEWRIADVLDEQSLASALKDIEVVYHCAAVVSLGSGSEAMIDTNVRGTRNIVDSALKAGVRKFCFVSSIAACGHAVKGEKIDESTEWIDNEKRSSYSRSKYYSEQEVWKGIGHGLNAVIVNPGVILGVSGTDTGSSKLFAQVRKGLKFYTNGGSGYVDVQDVVRAMIWLTNSKIHSERFILVSENSSNKDILSWMADGFGKQRPFISIDRKVLWIVGLLSEFLAAVFRFAPLIDRQMAQSATNRSFYSSRKIIELTDFRFTPVSKCIADVCCFLTKKEQT